MTPNSTKLLRRWGLGDTLDKLAAIPEVFTISRYTGHKILGRCDGFGREMLAKYGSPFCDIHRADLQLAMFERAKRLGVRFMFGASVTKYDFESPSVTLANGDRVDGDLIIAADGKGFLSFLFFHSGQWTVILTRVICHRFVVESTIPVPGTTRQFTISYRRLGLSYRLEHRHGHG